MASRSAPKGRSAEYAWLLTGPLALVSVVLVTLVGLVDGRWGGRWLLALAFLILLILTQSGTLYVVIRREGFTFSVTEIPLVLAFYFLPPVTVVLVLTAASLVTEVRRRVGPTKLWFNVARAAAGGSTACLLLVTLPPIDGAGPATWGVLFAAVGTYTIMTLLAVTGVITLLQGLQSGWDALRAAVPALITVAINVPVGLVFLIALDATGWSAVLLAALVVGMVLIYRSYAEFFRQHRTLADVYELTRAVTERGQDGTLIDALLVRVRALMQAEYATLWLPKRGRHPEVLLTARMDDSGLLDLSRTPLPVRERAMAERRTVGVGAKIHSDVDLRPGVRDVAVKDVIVVPLRSGSAVIGTVEVVNRLGDLGHFTTADVQVLETIAAHAGVAVENSRLVDRLQHDAYHDSLTGLPNRRRVTGALEAALKVRAPGEVVAVLLFDVDGLRDVNESLGHAAGDRVVAEVAARLRRQAPTSALVGRVGGDEFAVTLRAASAEAAVELAGELRAEVRAPMVLGTVTLDVDTAVGVVVHPEHGDEPAVLLQRADLATTAAKSLPNGVQLFNPALESRAVRRLGLAADLRQALDGGQFEVHFQPKITLADRRLIGVECLARWEHPAHGAVAPEDFVAVAEHTGQIGRLTEAVLREGLRRCREWTQAGDDLSIAVNLSTRTLADPAFPGRVGELLAEYGVSAGQVVFEVAEPGVAGDTDRVVPALNRLRELGVRLAVDDFGTGASSLSALRRLPVHEVKIDRSFVQSMATDPGDAALVRTVIGLCRELGLGVVAEGVESELTLELLTEMGCEVGQGFLFSRPLPVERLTAWLGARTEAESTPAGEVRRLRAVL